MKTTFDISQDYKRIVGIRACPNIKRFNMTVQDQMLTAKNPKELQTKFHWVMTKDDLILLRSAIDAALVEDLSENIGS